MANMAKVLKDEIQRIVRRELSQAVSALKKDIGAVKKTQTAYKRRIAALEKQAARMKPAARVATEPAAWSTVDSGDIQRVTAKSLKSLRSRLGITQAELAKLLGVSVQVVSVWEAKKGSVQIRKESARVGLAALKQEKKADVCERLGKDVRKKKMSLGKAAAGGGKKTLRAAVKKTASGGLVDTGLEGARIVELRERLGVSQQAFARLVGVSNQIVSVWERRPGMLKLRAATAQSLNDVLHMSKAEAKRRLG